MIAIVSHCISFEELFDHEMTFQVVLNSRNECNTSCKEHQTTKTFKQWPQRLSDVALFISETFSHASKQLKIKKVSRLNRRVKLIQMEFQKSFGLIM